MSKRFKNDDDELSNMMLKSTIKEQLPLYTFDLKVGHNEIGMNSLFNYTIFLYFKNPENELVIELFFDIIKISLYPLHELKNHIILGNMNNGDSYNFSDILIITKLDDNTYQLDNKEYSGHVFNVNKFIITNLINSMFNAIIKIYKENLYDIICNIHDLDEYSIKNPQYSFDNDLNLLIPELLHDKFIFDLNKCEECINNSDKCVKYGENINEQIKNRSIKVNPMNKIRVEKRKENN